MILVMYHPKYNSIRLYHTVWRGWADMIELSVPGGSRLDDLVGYGWELVGEL